SIVSPLAAGRSWPAMTLLTARTVVLGGEATVDSELMSCQVGGCVGTEEDQRAPQVVGLGHAAQGHTSTVLRQELRVLVRPHAAGRQRVDPHAARAPQAGEVLGELHEPGLRGAVG